MKFSNKNNFQTHENVNFTLHCPLQVTATYQFCILKNGIFAYRVFKLKFEKSPIEVNPVSWSRFSRPVIWLTVFWLLVSVLRGVY